MMSMRQDSPLQVDKTPLPPVPPVPTRTRRQKGTSPTRSLPFPPRPYMYKSTKRRVPPTRTSSVEPKSPTSVLNSLDPPVTEPSPITWDLPPPSSLPNLPPAPFHNRQPPNAPNEKTSPVSLSKHHPPTANPPTHTCIISRVCILTDNPPDIGTADKSPRPESP